METKGNARPRQTHRKELGWRNRSRRSVSIFPLRCQYRFLLRPPKSELQDFIQIFPTRIHKNVLQTFTSILIAVMTITFVIVMKWHWFLVLNQESAETRNFVENCRRFQLEVLQKFKLGWLSPWSSMCKLPTAEKRTTYTMDPNR